MRGQISEVVKKEQGEEGFPSKEWPTLVGGSLGQEKKHTPTHAHKSTHEHTRAHMSTHVHT